MATGENNRDPVPELVTYALTQSFSRVSHRPDHDSLSPIIVEIVTGRLQCCDHLGPAP